ncbi:MAG: Prolyl-tRNA synthetase [Candidatus Woesebacteria bacterium GW2011_GWB1_39_12]|uniref:Proline--tRNA ligase n=2 Tax=Candidatus Woeseibacteriota TaxID=1752722 RepID=A0A0G0ME69_9BACT|nr:MAG: Prolyl-tRNA synthetase [Candidatus Woesebacteria bacterium GW2011_GWA1_39_12]KKR00778.1 MAG: Prolyl-tRNA synthetase [Candidatus Woesebacteria bacterium GW2011_GWB1_39_12]
MRQSSLFPKTKKEAPKDAESINHKLLVRAGFIDQLMAGSWTLLPMGWRVVNKINQIIREEMNSTGAQEILMPLMHPKEVWQETGRWDTAREIMYQLKDSRNKDLGLGFTHEEIVLDLVRKHITSYQDLPLALYHFSTKFRNEPRARSGILRGREFMMKDLYSIHAGEEDFWKYYEEVKKAYCRVFKRLGFDFKITEAAGGVFTDNNTHEFQVLAEGGEDTIYYCEKCDFAQNQEIFKAPGPEGLGPGGVITCPVCKKGSIRQSKSIEVGNIFPFGTYYSERMRVYYTDEKGMRKPVWFGSYGIGSTRVMGTWVEVSHDERGIIWNKTIAPFDVHLLDIRTNDKGQRAKEIYQKLEDSGIEALWDDRNVGAGEKFADADLIGIPVRLVTSEKTKDKIEWKSRASEKTELLTIDQVIEAITKSRL